jgi:positive regulator of sigma E activity
MLNREEIIEEGVVESYENGTAIVKIIRKGTCDSCSAKVFCNSNNDENKVTATSQYRLAAGDNVRISIPARNITSASTYMYGIPLLLIMAGLLIGHFLFTEQRELFQHYYPSC